MATAQQNRIEIELSNGYKLVAEQNTDPQYSREIFIGIINPDGLWYQDLAIVRNSYHYDGDEVIWTDGLFDILVFGEENSEDFTEDFSVSLYEEEENV